MFGFGHFEQLEFLAGRWRGVSADGKEQYTIWLARVPAHSPS